MKLGSNRRLRAFWLRLAIAYVALVVIWPFVYSGYARHLGTFSAPLVQWLVYGPAQVRAGWHNEQLAMHVVVADHSGVKRDIGIDLAPIRYGFSHITFLALVVAIPGWTWRRRIGRWFLGFIAIEAFNIAIVVMTVFGEIASMNLDFWPGDAATTLLPRSLVTSYLNLISLVGAQFVPILSWLLLFVFPQRRSKGTAQSYAVIPPMTKPRLSRRRSTAA